MSYKRSILKEILRRKKWDQTINKVMMMLTTKLLEWQKKLYNLWFVEEYKNIKIKF